MRSLRFCLLASSALTCTFAASSTSALTSTAHVFDVVTEYSVSNNSRITFTGVLSGATTTIQITIASSTADLGASCERAIVQMVNRPGRFQFAVDDGNAAFTSTTIYPQTCSLRQRP